MVSMQIPSIHGHTADVLLYFDGGDHARQILLLGEYVMVGSIGWLRAEGSFLTHVHKIGQILNESTTSTYDLLNIAHDLRRRKAVTRGINTH